MEWEEKQTPNQMNGAKQKASKKKERKRNVLAHTLTHNINANAKKSNESTAHKLEWQSKGGQGKK